MAKLKDWIDWQEVALKHAKKKGKIMPDVKPAGNAVNYIVFDEAKVLDDFVDVVNQKKFINNWWGLKADGFKDHAPPQQIPMFDIPNPNKFVEEIVHAEPELKLPDPFNDNLKEVTKELKEIVDYAYQNGEEPPLTLVRALNRIKELEEKGNGDDWINGYHVGFADGSGNNPNKAKPHVPFPPLAPWPGDFEPEPDDPEV